MHTNVGEKRVEAGQLRNQVLSDAPFGRQSHRTIKRDAWRGITKKCCGIHKDGLDPFRPEESDCFSSPLIS